MQRLKNNLHIEVEKHYNNWNEEVGGLETELNLLKIQLMKNSLNIAQIVQSSPDPCHMVTSVRTQPHFSFILQPERGYKYICQGIYKMGQKDTINQTLLTCWCMKI